MFGAPFFNRLQPPPDLVAACRGETVHVQQITIDRRGGREVLPLLVDVGEQQRGIEEIRISLTQMDQVVQENSALVEKTSAVSDSLSKQARDLMAMLQGAEVFVKG